MSCKYSFQFTYNFLLRISSPFFLIFFFFLLLLATFCYKFGDQKMPSLDGILLFGGVGMLIPSSPEGPKPICLLSIIFHSSFGGTSSKFVPFQTVLTNLCPLHFHTNFRINLLIYAANIDDILIGITVNMLTKL